MMGRQPGTTAAAGPHQLLHTQDRVAVNVVVVAFQRLLFEPHDGASLPIEEETGIDRTAEKHIVVGVEKMLGQTGNPGQKQFDRARVEDGKNLRRHDLAVRNHPHTRIRRVEPRRRLVVGQDVDAANPRRITLGRTQRIAQFVVLDETALPRRLGVHPLVGRQISVFLRQPRGVVAIDPEVHQINFHSRTHLSAARRRQTGIRSNSRKVCRSPHSLIFSHVMPQWSYVRRVMRRKRESRCSPCAAI